MKRLVKIVCFGGGNAMPKSVVPGLLKYGVDLVLVNSAVDNGSSTGQLKSGFDVLSPGDLSRHLLSLSMAPDWKKELFAFRFEHGEFEKDYVFGNLFLTGLESVVGDYEKVLDIAHDFLEVNGKCFPATIEKTNLFAVLENGEIVKGESNIDIPKHNGSIGIKSVFLEPKVKSYKKVIDAINEADLILIGPGDFYSSLVPCFLSEGIIDAIKQTSAKKCFICPAMTKFGETNNFSAGDFSAKIEEYFGCCVDFVVYNNKVPSIKRINEYKKNKFAVLDVVSAEQDLDEKKFIGRDLLIKEGSVEFDSDKVAKVIFEDVIGHGW
ncbi:MAG: YvcK family protein [Candidatus Diapherotrites archaeon]|nr:YvcK family protein [Candidatus Diapherotrites archaeon]